MDLDHEHEVLIADDSTQFACEIVRLYQDPALWQKLSRKGITYIQNRLSPEAIAPLLLDAVVLSREMLTHNSGGVIVRCFEYLRKPWKLLPLFSSSIEALRKGGTAELRSRVKMWTNRT